MRGERDGPDETRVGLDAGALATDEVEGRVVGHVLGGDEVGNDDGSAPADALRESACVRGEERGTHLLAMDKNVEAAAEAVVDPADGLVEVGADVGGGRVEDVEAVALEGAGGGRGVGDPGGVEDLHECCDTVLVEELLVEGGSEGAEVECAGVGGGGDNEVHGRAHGLHDLWRDVVEADHGVGEHG